MMDTLQDRLLSALDGRKMTQADLARATGLTRAAVSRYCKGERIPTGPNLVSIARALLVTPQWLTGDESRYAPALPSFADKFGADAEKTVSLLVELDAVDMAEIRGEIKAMLRSEKYYQKDAAI